MKPANWWT